MDVQAKLEELKKVLKIEEKEKRIAEIEDEMQAADFWADQEKANTKTRELKNLKTDVDKIKELQDLAKMAEGDDLRAIEEEIRKLEIYTYFSGKYDDHNTIINFYAGAGGDDAQDWTEMLLRLADKSVDSRFFFQFAINIRPIDFESCRFNTSYTATGLR